MALHGSDFAFLADVINMLGGWRFHVFHRPSGTEWVLKDCYLCFDTAFDVVMGSFVFFTVCSGSWGLQGLGTLSAEDLMTVVVPFSRVCKDLGSTHRPLSSSVLGLPYRILNMNHTKELLRGLWVDAFRGFLHV